MKRLQTRAKENRRNDGAGLLADHAAVLRRCTNTARIK